MSAPKFVLVLNNPDFAVYARQAGASLTTWTLVTSGTDPEGVAQRTALSMGQRTSEQDMDVVHDLIHLNAGGTWPQVVTSFRPPTARQRVEAEIANLRADAASQRERAGYSDDRGGQAHAARMAERADAMQHVLDILDSGR
jgi:hypothetical protein